MPRIASAVVLAVFLAIPLPAAQRPNYDALADAPLRETARLQKSSALLSPARRSSVEERLGLPTFVWPALATSGVPVVSLNAKGKFTGASSSIHSLAETTARGHIAHYAPLYGLRANELASVVLTNLHDLGHGPVIATFHQEIDGIEVFRDALRVIMNSKGELVALSGYVAGSDAGAPLGASPAFAIDASSAIAAALDDLGSTDLAQPARVKKVYFHLPDRFEPAYYIEVSAASSDSADSDDYSYVISATDRRVLFRNNLTADDSYSYRVWADPSGAHLPFDGPQGSNGSPHPTGIPDGYQAPLVPQNLITLEHGPISTNDPWLPPSAFFLTGNNVEAYADLQSPDGFTPASADFRGAASIPGLAFDYTYDFAQLPTTETNRLAALTDLFYVNNFFHDWYYDSGFDEAAGNAQASNYGRGGFENDSIKAEGQDFNGRNNANMSTPADGGRPRMQMFLFDRPAQRSVSTSVPVSAAYSAGTAVFGPASFDTPADIVWVDDGVTSTGSIHDGCQFPWLSNVSGKIALIDRGGPCASGFVTKARNAQASGAVGVIIANIATSVSPTVPPGMAGTAADVTIGVLSLNLADGDTLRTQANAGTVTGRIVRETTRDNDGTIDNQIIAHEWAHYLSNRLVGNANGLTNNQGRGMGEGWSDFNALLMTVKEGDDSIAASNANFNGVYGLAGYVFSGKYSTGQPNDAYYFGIRRVPYSTDMTRDPLTFKHTADGVAIAPPFAGPIAFGADGFLNAEVHNTGEVWATMLWECYAALLRDTLGVAPRLTFQQAQDRMRMYLVASLKATPNAPTILEARDALLAAALANDPVDFLEFGTAFAKRGAGTQAVAADRYSVKNQQPVESFTGPGDVLITSMSLADDVQSCDSDGILDNGESGMFRLTIRNEGATSLAAPTAALSSSDAGVTIANAGLIVFPAIAPGATATAGVSVSLGSVAGIGTLTFHVDVTGASAGTATFTYRGNTDDLPASQTSDNVESTGTAWTVTGLTPDGSIGWTRHANSPADHNWFVPDSGGTTDVALVSPTLAVGPGPFTITFGQRFEFEFDTNLNAYDGGVIEISNDGGATWNDIGAANISPSYNVTLATYGGNTNPLAGRNAFALWTEPFGGYVAETISLGTTFANQNVKIRFRFGADGGGPAHGWEIDNIAFNGITNTPFAALQADTGHLPCTIATTTTLGTSAAVANFGEAVTFTADVAAPSGVLDGSVTFFDGATSIGIVPISGAQAQLTTSSLGLGAHVISAQYASDSTHASSTATAIGQTIRPLTTIALGTSAATAPFATAVTFTATVAVVSPGTGTPTGSVRFFDNGVAILATASTNASGVATFTTPNLSTGPHSITASFLGTASYGPSTSTALSETITQSATTTTLTSSLGTAFFGDPITFTAVVNNTSASGNVTFKDGATVIGVVDLTGGPTRRATLTTSAFVVATHPITAEYSGDVNLIGSTSGGLNLEVKAFDAPANLNAIGDATPSVAITWSPVEGAAVYEIYRSVNGGGYGVAGSPSTNAFTDSTGLTAGLTYVYQIRAKTASGTPSPFSGFEVATTIDFVDDAVVAGTTPIKARHIEQLQEAITALASSTGTGPFTLTPVAVDTPIQASTLIELRNAVVQARSSLGLSTPFAQPDPVAGGRTVSASDIQELRNVVK